MIPVFVSGARVRALCPLRRMQICGRDSASLAIGVEVDGAGFGLRASNKNRNKSPERSGLFLVQLDD